jgi:hypothetical protein
MTTFYRQRADFEKQLLAELTPRLTKTKWRKRSCALFNQSGDYYQDLFISVHRNSTITTAELRFKPMALDPILWDVLGIPENLEMPLSFRTWGAFVCRSLPIFSTQVEQQGDTPAIVADRLIALCHEKSEFFKEALGNASFSNIVATHPNQVERGAYAVTLVTSLINEGNLRLARDTAHAYASGALFSCSQLTVSGKSFHQFALDWLTAGKR